MSVELMVVLPLASYAVTDSATEGVGLGQHPVRGVEGVASHVVDGAEGGAVDGGRVGGRLDRGDHVTGQVVARVGVAHVGGGQPELRRPRGPVQQVVAGDHLEVLRRGALASRPGDRRRASGGVVRRRRLRAVRLGARQLLVHLVVRHDGLRRARVHRGPGGVCEDGDVLREHVVVGVLLGHAPHEGCPRSVEVDLGALCRTTRPNSSKS